MAIESAAQTLSHNAVACGQQHRDLRMRQRSGQRQGVCLHRARPGNEYRRDSPQWHGRYRRGLCMMGFRRRRIASMGARWVRQEVRRWCPAETLLQTRRSH